MRLPIPQITIFVLVLHMGLGCCWHHGHQGPAGCCQAAGCDHDGTVLAPCGHHEHEHDGLEHQHATHDDGTAPTPNHPQRRDAPCPEGRCVFARLSQSWQPVLDSTDETVVPAEIEPCLADVQNLAIRSIDAGPRRWCCDTRPPLRVHLVLQILQI